MIVMMVAKTTRAGARRVRKQLRLDAGARSWSVGVAGGEEAMVELDGIKQGRLLGCCKGRSARIARWWQV